jgi:hypothetical protein
MFGGSAPVIGARVITIEGDELGNVKEVVGDSFKIDAAARPDYWLGKETIASSTEMELRLSISKDQVGDAKLGGPD